MATRRIGNVTINYTPTQDQTQMYNMLGRDAGQTYSNNNGGGNFFENIAKGFADNIGRKANAVGNTVSTTLSAPVSLANDIVTNVDRGIIDQDRDRRMNQIAQDYGFNNYHDLWDAYFDAKDNGTNMDLVNKYEAEIAPKLESQATENKATYNDWANKYEDYRKNDFISQKINQDRGKYLGDSITTLSTAADIAAMGTGLPMGVVANTIQGGAEGLASELSENGFQNFDWDRAKNNMITGAVSGAATAGLNKMIPAKAATQAPGILKSVAQGAGRGALSGAVGGAAGAATSSALNGQDLGTGIGNTLAGALQGSASGAFSGGVMGGVNALGNKVISSGLDRAQARAQAGENATAGDKFFNKVAEIQNTGKRWTDSGDNFKERLAATRESGDSWALNKWDNLKNNIKNWSTDMKQGFVANPFYQGDDTADANVGYIKKYQNQGMGIRKATDEAYKDLVRDAYDEDMGGYEGALEDARAAGYPNETNYQKAQRFLQGGGMDIYPEDMFESLRSIYGPDFKESTYKNKDGSWKVKNGEYYVETMYKNQIAQRMAKDMDAMDAGTYQNSQANQNLKPGDTFEKNGETFTVEQGKNGLEGVSQDRKVVTMTPDDYTKNRLDYLEHELYNGNISYEELAELQSYAPQILAMGDAELAEAAGIPESDFRAYQNGDDNIIQKYSNSQTTQKTASTVQPQDDLATRMAKDGWKSMPDLDGITKVAENNGWRVMDNGDTLEFRNYSPAGEELIFEVSKVDPVRGLENEFRNFDQKEHAQMWVGGNGAPSEDVLVEDAADIDQMLYTLYQEANDVERIPLQQPGQPTQKQSLGDKILDKVVKGGMKEGFVKNPFAKEDTSNYTDDINNMQINRNDMMPTDNNPETELYRQLTGNQERSMQSSPVPTTTAGDAWDGLAREYGYASYDDAIKAYAQANPNKPITAGAITTWLDSNEGTYNPNALRNISEAEVAEPMDSSLEKVFETKTNKIQKRNKAQSIGNALENAGEGVSYREVYDALDPKTATRAQETKAVQRLAEMDVKPRNYEEYAKTSSEVNRVASELADKSGVKVIAPDLATELSPSNLDVNLTDDAAKTYNNYVRQIVADGSNPDEYSAGYLLEKSRWLGDKAEKVRGSNADDIKQALRAAKWVVRDKVSEAMANSGITGEGTTELLAQDLKNLGANQKVIDYYTAPGKNGKAPNISELINRSSLFEQARDMGTQIGAEAMTRSASKYPASSVKQFLRTAGLDQLANVALDQLVAPITGGAMKLAGKGISAVGNAVAGLQNGGNANANTTTANNPQTRVYDLLNKANTLNIIGRNAGEEAGGAITPKSNNASAAGVVPLAPNTGVPEGTTLEDLAGTDYIGTDQNTMANTLDGGYGSYGSYGGSESALDPTAALYQTAMKLAMEAGDADAYAQLYQLYANAVANSQKSTTDLTVNQQNQLAKIASAEEAVDQMEQMLADASGAKGVIGGTLQGWAGNIGLDSNAKAYNDMVTGFGSEISKVIGKQNLPQITDDAETAAIKIQTLRDALAKTKANYYRAYGLV